MFRRDRYGWGDFKQVTWLTARLDFQHAFAARVGSRLAQARLDAEMSAKAHEVADMRFGSPGTDLVLVAKRETVHDYHRKNSNARGTYRGYRNGGADRSRRAGSEAGARAKLSSNVEIGGARKALA